MDKEYQILFEPVKIGSIAVRADYCRCHFPWLQS